MFHLKIYSDKKQTDFDHDTTDFDHGLKRMLIPAEVAITLFHTLESLIMHNSIIFCITTIVSVMLANVVEM